MSILADHEIARLARDHGMIEPFVAEQVRAKASGHPVVSYGLTSAGYDIRAADEWICYRAPEATDLENWTQSTMEPRPLDIKAPERLRRRSHAWQGDATWLPPQGHILARSVEYFRMPRDVIGTVLGKSTWARQFIHVLVTPLEPGWEGHITIEVVNLNSEPVWIYANEGIAQVQFHRLAQAPLVTYADRAGKYQGQTGITLPRM